MTLNFGIVAMDQIINHVSKARYMFGGQVNLPMVIRAAAGGGTQKGAQHSHSIESWFVNAPGIRVVLPSTPYDLKGLLKTAIRCEDPVLFIEHEMLYNMKGEVPDERVPAPVRRRRREAARAATSRSWPGRKMVHEALRAAELLADEGIEAEVIDPRTLDPLDRDTILRSVLRTRRAVVVEEGWRNVGVGAEIASQIHEALFYELEAPVQRVARGGRADALRVEPREARAPRRRSASSTRCSRSRSSRERPGDTRCPSRSACRSSPTRWKRARLIAWRKRVGDPVKRGEVIAEIETDKADMEFEAYTEGVVAQIVVEAGATVPVGTLIAVLRLPGESEDAVARCRAAQAQPQAASAAPAAKPAAPAAPRLRAASAAPRAAAAPRRRARAGRRCPRRSPGRACPGAARRGRRPPARDAARAAHGRGEVDRSRASSRAPGPAARSWSRISRRTSRSSTAQEPEADGTRATPLALRMAERGRARISRA